MPKKSGLHGTGANAIVDGLAVLGVLGVLGLWVYGVIRLALF